MERKLDTREKIQLGGLVVKVGLRNEDKDALLGGLIELAETLQNPNEHTRLAKLGEKNFNMETETISSSSNDDAAALPSE